MLLTECDKALSDVASSFGVPLKAERLNSYYEVFQDVADSDWKRICQKAKMTCERFPTIKEFCSFAYDAGAFGKSFAPSDWQAFDCVCGHSFVFNIKQARERPDSNIKCPGVGYEKCNKSYALGYLLNRPQIESVPVCSGCGQRHFPSIECVEVEQTLRWMEGAFHGKDQRTKTMTPIAELFDE
jgi:hypothetical protein